MKIVHKWFRENITQDDIFHIIKWSAAIFCVLLAIKFISIPDQKTKYEKEIAIWQEKATNVIAENDSLRKQIDILEIEVDKKEQESDSLSLEIIRIVDSANKDRNELDAKLDSLKLAMPECEVTIQIAEQYRAKVDSLTLALVKSEQRDSIRVSQIFLLQQGIEKLQVQNDSLKSLIVTVPVAEPEKLFGLIPYPSRKTTFILGGISGVVAVLLVK